MWPLQPDTTRREYRKRKRAQSIKHTFQKFVKRPTRSAKELAVLSDLFRVIPSLREEREWCIRDDDRKVAAMRQNLNAASSHLLARWSSNGRYGCPYYRCLSLIQSYATAACILPARNCFHSSMRILRLPESEEVKEQRLFSSTWQNVATILANRLTHASPTIRRNFGILSTNISLCALNPQAELAFRTLATLFFSTSWRDRLPSTIFIWLKRLVDRNLVER